MMQSGGIIADGEGAYRKYQQLVNCGQHEPPTYIGCPLAYNFDSLMSGPC